MLHRETKSMLFFLIHAGKAHDFDILRMEDQEILIFSQWPETTLRYVEEMNMDSWNDSRRDYCNRVVLISVLTRL